MNRPSDLEVEMLKGRLSTDPAVFADQRAKAAAERRARFDAEAKLKREMQAKARAAVGPKASWKTFPAKYPGKCVICGDTHPAGQPIRWKRGVGVRCLECE